MFTHRIEKLERYTRDAMGNWPEKPVKYDEHYYEVKAIDMMNIIVMIKKKLEEDRVRETKGFVSQTLYYFGYGVSKNEKDFSAFLNEEPRGSNFRANDGSCKTYFDAGFDVSEKGFSSQDILPFKNYMKVIEMNEECKLSLYEEQYKFLVDMCKKYNYDIVTIQ